MSDDVLYRGLNLSAMSRNQKKTQILLKKALNEIEVLKKQHAVLKEELSMKQDDTLSYLSKDPRFKGMFKK